MAVKGQVHTVESVLASLLFLGIVIAVIPQVVEEPDENRIDDRVRKSVEMLDKTGNLTDNMSHAALEDDLDPHIPPGWNFTVRVSEVVTVTRNAEAGENFFLDQEGNYTELQLWVKEASGLNVSFDGNTVVEDRQTRGYLDRSLSNSTGWLNFTGSGKAHFDFDTYRKDGNIVFKENLRSVDYMVYDNGTKQVQVKMWR